MTRISRDAYGLKLAEAAASRADCTRRQVGAVIVAEDGSVVATGYNGLASGLPGCASAGACPRGQMAYPSEPPVAVGDADTLYETRSPGSCGAESPVEWWACTLGENHGGGWHVASTGARSKVLAVWPATPTHPADTGYESTGCRAVHAEVNAIIRAGRDRCVGATIYVTDEPCFHCSVVIEGAGIARVVTPASDAPFAARREEMARQEEAHAARIGEWWGGNVPATAPPPSVAAGAPTYATGGYVGPSNAGPALRTSGPLDPWIQAALVRAVERARADAEGISAATPVRVTINTDPRARTADGITWTEPPITGPPLRGTATPDIAHEVREDIRSDFLNDDGLAPWER